MGTAALAVLPCPPRQCASRAAVAPLAPLGATVELVEGVPPEEGPSGRFLRVRSGNIDGYAQDWYLREDGHDAPYLRQGEAGCRRLALIFNIGVGFDPDLGILDTLEAMDAAATMFVMGWWADRHPAALQRMVQAEYLIGSHGYDAVELPELDDAAVAADLMASAAAIEHATGQPPARLFTPYAAAMDDRVRAIIASRGFLPVAWTVSGADYGPAATEQEVYDHVMADVHDGALIELHLDGPASAVSTGRALPRLIDRLRADGFRLVSISDMLLPCSSVEGEQLTAPSRPPRS
ncbi:MAG: polysaccharide deacetylase family protein [Chloroflexia bacterium]|nr:polysaccharide deacetylase family protein [Chloroflexia bacterium]